jgi:hypothetical protein
VVDSFDTATLRRCGNDVVAVGEGERGTDNSRYANSQTG